jgi:hypothetical protein
MRFALVAATVVVVALAGLTELTQAQNNSCKSVCDCNSFECTDFCSPTACGGGTCRRQFDKMVKACRSACKQCNDLMSRKK